MPTARRTPLAVDGYVRVSRVGGRRGERFISPAVQREEIVAWARFRRARLLEVFVELDQSGGRPDRPKLEEAISRVERGVSRGVVVASADRFGRLTLEGLQAIKRITDAGGSLYSIEEGLDFGTAAGRWYLREMLSMAELDLDRRRENFDQARARAIARGVHVATHVPVGYHRTARGRLVPDRRTAAVMAEVFRRRGDGETLSSLCRFLEERGIRTASGNPGWHAATLSKNLRNRVYLGEVSSGRYVNTDAHRPLIDRQTWERAQRTRHNGPRRSRPKGLLAGFVRCASCSMKMRVDGWRRSSHGYYACSGRFSSGPCPAPAYIGAKQLESCVEDVMFDLLTKRRRPPRVRLERAQQRQARAQTALARYRNSDAVLWSLGANAFAAGIELREARVRAAAAEVAALEARIGIHDLPPTAELEHQWTTMTIEHRRALLARVIDCVFVGPGRGDFADRVTVCPAGTEPADLVRPGHKHPTLRRYQPRARWINAADVPRQARHWTPSRLERELRAFLAGRETWPVPETFRAHGRGRLHHQAVIQGGEQWWADRLGLTIARPSQPWTDERIRAALKPYLADKDRWPSTTQFRADGLTPLTAAISQHGGAARWAAEFGLERAIRGYGPHVYWTDERILETLDEFCRGRTAFPTRQELLAAGLGAMHNRMRKRGGIERWAQRLGLRFVPSGKTWTDERIRAALQTYLAGKDRWPTTAQFKADGLAALGTAIRKHGGAQRWADELGIERASRHIGRRTYWTDERIRDQLEALCKGRTTFPSRDECRAAGLEGMFNAITEGAGPHWWAAQIGLPRPHRPHRRSRTSPTGQPSHTRQQPRPPGDHT